MRNHRFYPREIFGEDWDFSREMIMMWARAQLIVAGADGLSERELRACHDVARSFGATEDMIDELKKFDFEHARLEDYLPAEVRPWARSLLYFAIKVASWDREYSELERSALRKTAKILGIEEDAVVLIEGIVEAEMGVRRARMAALAPPAASK